MPLKEKKSSVKLSLGKFAAKEILKGGLADGKKSSEFPRDQLRMGQKIELEHTNNKAKATEIAKDHLVEDKKYYTKLKKMEKKSSAASDFILDLGKEVKQGLRSTVRNSTRAASTGGAAYLGMKAANKEPARKKRGKTKKSSVGAALFLIHKSIGL